MLIRLVILSAFVLLVHLVVGMFARDQIHELAKRAAKDDGGDAAGNAMFRRRHLLSQQPTAKRVTSQKSARRYRNSQEETLHAEETSYAGALVKRVEDNSSLPANENKTISDSLSNITSDAKDNHSIDTSTESKEISSTPLTRKRRPIHHATESSSIPSHLPVAAALTMSESLYNHFRPLDSEVPEDQFLPFLQFGKKLVPNAKTTFAATVTGSTNALDSVTNSPRTREHSSFNPPAEIPYQTPVTKSRPSEEEVNEDMDVAVVKSVVEKNKATRGKINSLHSIRNVGGLYRKEVETKENLVNTSDKSSINDTGANLNDTKDLEPKRLATVLAGKKNFEVIVDSNGRRKIVAVSRRPLFSNITAPVTTTTDITPGVNISSDKKNEQNLTESSITSTSTTTVSPTTPSSTSTVTQPVTTSSPYLTITSSSPSSSSTTSTTVQPTITSTTVSTSTTLLSNISSVHSTISEIVRDELSSSHDPTEFSSSNVVAARTNPQRPISRNSTGLLTRRRQSSLYNPARKSYPLRTGTFRPIADNRTELDMIPDESNVSSSFTSTTDNSSATETTAKPTSIIEKYQLMRMTDARGGRRHLRQNHTDLLRTNKYFQDTENEPRLVNDTRTPISSVEALIAPRNISVISEVSPPQLATSELPPTSTSPIPTTKILSTAVVTSVSIKGTWTSGATEMPPQLNKDSIAPVDNVQVVSDLTESQSHNSTTEVSPSQTSAHTTAPGSATYSMIKDLLAEMNTSYIPTNIQGTQGLRNVAETESEADKTDDIVRKALPLSDEHYVGVDKPRPVFSNSSVEYTTSYRGQPRSFPKVPLLPENITINHSYPTLSTTTSTTTTPVPTPYITTSSISTSSSESTSFSIDISQTAFLSSTSSRPIVDMPPAVNTSVYQQDNSSTTTEQSLNKGRALWRNTTSRPSTSIPVIQSSDKDFDLPLVKLYNSSTAWSESIQPTEQMVHAETQYDTVPKVDDDFTAPENHSDHIVNRTMVDISRCGGNNPCFENVSTTSRPILAYDCSGKNATREGCSSRPVEGSVASAEATSSIEMAAYVLAGICVIPAAVGALFLVRCMLRHRRKVLEESDTCSEISCHRAGENGEATTPASTKLPRLQPHLGWDHEKPPIPPPAVQDTNNRWEFPRSRLRLQTVLGQGNFGQVLKAEADDLNDHSGTTRLVAVKLVKEGATTREKEDLLRELEIMKQLGAHPNVVTLLGCCTEQEPYLLIMEYVMYGKLLTFLRDHRTRQNYYNFSEDSDALTSRDLTVFGYCVARGMEYLVSKGIIHRDLAARNVLVDHNKLCKIADFGMSRSVRELGEIYEQRQTKGALPIRWMAPESLLYRVFTHKSDVWSFGILMWEIVTLGSTPYPTMGAREVMRKVREGYRLERPSHCRPELFRVINHCWHADPTKRPDFSELKRELGTLVEDAREGKYVDLDRFAEYSGGRMTTLHSGGDPELIHM